MTNTRTATDLKGTFGSPVSVSAGATDTSTALTTPTGSLLEGSSTARITIGGTPPTTNPTLQPQYSRDGTNWYDDGGPYVVPLVASAIYTYQAVAPYGSVSSRWVLTNGTGSAITWSVQGSTVGVT